VTAARHCSRRDNRIGCFVGDNRARGLHANERVAPLNTSNAYIRAYLGLSGAQTGCVSRKEEIYSMRGRRAARFSRALISAKSRGNIQRVATGRRLVAGSLKPSLDLPYRLTE